MANTLQLFDAFRELGGEFLVEEEEWLTRLRKVKAFVFDWDGVFNAGVKSPQTPSPFSEPDSMGVNLLRYGYWLTHRQELPHTAIITGATNETAQYFAKREHFHSIFFGFKHKTEALSHFCKQYQLASNEIAFVFDDILDLSVAREVGLRCLVKRNSDPLFKEYIKNHSLCDYITAHAGNDYAVREICELFLGSYNMYEKVVDDRISFNESYQNYWHSRNSIETQFISEEK